MIKNIIFDIGNVLVDFIPGKVMKQLGMSDEKVTELLNATCDNKWWCEFDRGVMSNDDIINNMIKESPELTEEMKLFFSNEWENLVEPYPYSENWLKSLHDKGYKIFLLSNYPKKAFEVHSKTSFPFLQYVDGKIVSAFVKLVKPDADIYIKLLDEYKLIPEECVFIDDRQENIDSAIKLNINGIHFLNYQQANYELMSLL